MSEPGAEPIVEPVVTPEPVAPEPATSFIADDGTFAEGWIEKYVSEENRGDPIFGRIKTIQGLTAQTANLERMKGADTIAKPSDSFGDADWDDFHRAAGWTGEPIAFAAPEGLPEGVWSEERATKFSEKFNELRLSPKQVAGLVEVYNSDLMQQITNMGNNSDTAMANLKSELLAEKGNAYTQFEHNGNIAIEKGIDSPEHKQRVLDKFANDPDFVRMMGNLGANFAEAGGIPATKMAPTPTDIDAKIAEIRASDAYNNKRHPGYRAAQDNIKRLYEEKNAVKQPA